MNRIIRVIILTSLSAICFPVFAQKAEPVVDKETIKKVQQELKDKLPGAKIKTIKYDDGGVYIGECDKKIKQGFGIMYFAVGDVYRREWASDTNTGQGEMTYKRGDVYSGSWNNGIIEGQGEMTYANGDTYTGAWNNGTYDGVGKLSVAGQSLIIEGEWEDGMLISGVYHIGNSMTISGVVDEDAFIGDADLTFSSGYNYKGTCSIPKRVESTADLLKYICFLDGVLSQGSSVKIEGNWKGKQLSTGDITINKPNLVLSGHVEDNSFKGELVQGNETFKGVFSDRDNYGFLHGFLGEYIVRGASTIYSFNGTLNNNRPVDGELTIRDVTNRIHVDYDSKGQATITTKGKSITIPYINNEKLFQSVGQDGVKQSSSGFKPLDNKVFAITQKNTPLKRVDRVYNYTFFSEGTMRMDMWHVEGKNETEYKTTPIKTVTCPTCHGRGKITENGYNTSGQAYSRTIICPMCNGKGKTDSELANILDDGLNNFWSAVGTIETINGRTAWDFLNDSSHEYYPYTISGSTISINMGGGNTADYKLVNGTLVSQTDKSFVMTPRSDSQSRYKQYRSVFSDRHDNVPNYYVDTDMLCNPFLPFSILHPTPFAGTRFMYKNTRSVSPSSEAKVVKKSYSSGVGYFDLEKTVHSVCVGVFPFDGIGLRLRDEQPQTLQTPNTITNLFFAEKVAIKNIILTSEQPPRLDSSYAKEERHPEKNITFYVPANYYNNYKNDDVWKNLKVVPLTHPIVKGGLIVDEHPKIEDFLQ